MERPGKTTSSRRSSSVISTHQGHRRTKSLNSPSPIPATPEQFVYERSKLPEEVREKSDKFVCRVEAFQRFLPVIHLYLANMREMSLAEIQFGRTLCEQGLSESGNVSHQLIDLGQLYQNFPRKQLLEVLERFYKFLNKFLSIVQDDMHKSFFRVVNHFGEFEKLRSRFGADSQGNVAAPEKFLPVAIEHFSASYKAYRRVVEQLDSKLELTLYQADNEFYSVLSDFNQASRQFCRQSFDLFSVGTPMSRENPKSSNLGSDRAFRLSYETTGTTRPA